MNIKFLLKSLTCGITLGFTLGATVTASAQSEVSIETTQLTDSIYMLKGQGGNIGVSVGDDGIYIIDDQYAPLSDKIKQALAKLSKLPVRFVINTHWHGDHTGGNESFAQSGSVIVAHKNVRKRMSTDQFMKFFKREVKASPDTALPVITFKDEIAFHLNGDNARVIHVPNAHTDGDAIIHFEKANVIHTGDTVFNGMYPFIDTGSGGSIQGFLNNLQGILKLADDNTQIIPGHGVMTNKAELKKYHAMLNDIYSNYQQLKAEGLTFDEIKTQGISTKYDAQFGNGFIKPEALATFIHNSVENSTAMQMADKVADKHVISDHSHADQSAAK